VCIVCIAYTIGVVSFCICQATNIKSKSCHFYEMCTFLEYLSLYKGHTFQMSSTTNWLCVTLFTLLAPTVGILSFCIGQANKCKNLTKHAHFLGIHCFTRNTPQNKFNNQQAVYGIGHIACRVGVLSFCCCLASNEEKQHLIIFDEMCTFLVICCFTSNIPQKQTQQPTDCMSLFTLLIQLVFYHFALPSNKHKKATSCHFLTKHAHFLGRVIASQATYPKKELDNQLAVFDIIYIAFAVGVLPFCKTRNILPFFNKMCTFFVFIAAQATYPKIELKTNWLCVALFTLLTQLVFCHLPHNKCKNILF